MAAGRPKFRNSNHDRVSRAAEYLAPTVLQYLKNLSYAHFLCLTLQVPRYPAIQFARPKTVRSTTFGSNEADRPEATDKDETTILSNHNHNTTLAIVCESL